ncbi:ATP-binding cassette sub-family A member 3-like [Hyposmocoma kahamanoa]|uniref:ATP-binding cassette sub-family A member 3-like n=1 Tax=Hyposmocoma kahamanoa TaxID=1477025 RepID=UPI000E6D6843|nr:ATP-binding cassette sub-family A member 3-like [Hyposmocoma kahamanoa]
MAFYTGGSSALSNAKCAMNLCNPAQPSNATCCKHKNPSCYFCFGRDKPGSSMLILLVQTFIYMFLVLLTQHGYLKQWWNKLLNLRYVRPLKRCNDEMVRAEEVYVSNAAALPVAAQATNALLVKDVHENYVSLESCRIKNCNAVKGVSFSIKKGECFGVLGVNGAGKSSTFRTITGENLATLGRVVANGNFLTLCHRQRYFQAIAYCPQFYGLDEFLTGWDNLALLLRLRGFSRDDVYNEVETWIKVVGLERYAKERVNSYSGGCKRRLAAAAALAQGAPVTLLDEPTAGVDVSARRRVWSVLRRGLAQDRAIIITSHSLNEMEALCNRVAIMSSGELCALGSPAELRAKHAAGHVVRIKLRPTAHVGDSAETREKLKRDIHNQFNCTLKDEHKTMLHYHINERMTNSDLFKALESLKAAHPNLIEDYSATETTLEEVFLSFARDSQKNSNKNAPL